MLERDNLAEAKQQYEDAIAQCDEKQVGVQQALDDAEREVERCRAALDQQGAQAADNASRMTAMQTELAQNRSEAASEAARTGRFGTAQG